MKKMDGSGGGDNKGVEDYVPPVQDFGFPKRQFKGFSPTVPTAEQLALRKELGIGAPTPRQLPTGKQYIATPLLYDDQGRIAGRQYDLEDAFVVARELAKLTTEQRVAISQELYRVGWYGNNKISQAMLQGVGYSPEDENAWAKLLYTANTAQRPWQDTFGMLASFASVSTPGPTIRVTSDEDAAAYTREVFLAQLGRMPTRREMGEAANFIRARERQAYAAGQQMPNTGLIAESFAQKADPTSRIVYGLGNAISLAMQALGQ